MIKGGVNSELGSLLLYLKTTQNPVLVPSALTRVPAVAGSKSMAGPALGRFLSKVGARYWVIVRYCAPFYLIRCGIVTAL